jgi:hypothetical protein
VFFGVTQIGYSYDTRDNGKGRLIIFLTQRVFGGMELSYFRFKRVLNGFDHWFES